MALAVAAYLVSGATFGNTSVGKRAKPSVKLICDRLIDDFSGSRVGAFPRGWRTRDEDEMPEARAKRMYVVERERERKVLHARYRDTAITIGRLVRDGAAARRRRARVGSERQRSRRVRDLGHRLSVLRQWHQVRVEFDVGRGAAPFQASRP